MKLFAIAATAASGMGVQQHQQQHQQQQHVRSSSMYPHRFEGRVTVPAPGWVNEQGGYWADQNSIQSHHYQQPQQQQWPQQDQKPQCCQGYYWTSPTGESVWMGNVGEYDMKPIYKGEDSSGNVKFLYWEFEKNSFTPTWTPTPGHWYLGDHMFASGAIKSAPSYTARYCPHDQINRWDQSVQLRCGQQPQQHQPQQRQCCAKFRWTTPGNTTVYMRQTGAMHDQKPVYEGVDKIVTPIGGTTIVHTMFWRFDAGSKIKGAWYHSDIGVADPSATASDSVFGLDSCPNDHLGVSWGSQMKLQCATNDPIPGPLDTCQANWNRNQRSGIFYDGFVWGRTVGSECFVPRLMREIVNTQLSQFIFALDEPTEDLRAVYERMVQTWNEMANDSTCFLNWNVSMNWKKNAGNKGFIKDCNLICDEIKEVGSNPANFAGVLTQFKATIPKYFDNNTSNRQCIDKQQIINDQLDIFTKYVSF